MITPYDKIMNVRTFGMIAFGMIILGFLLSIISVYIENNIDILHIVYNPKITGMLFNNVGMLIITLGAVLLGIAISNNNIFGKK